MKKQILTLTILSCSILITTVFAAEQNKQQLLRPYSYNSEASQPINERQFSSEDREVKRLPAQNRQEKQHRERQNRDKLHNNNNKQKYHEAQED